MHGTQRSWSRHRTPEKSWRWWGRLRSAQLQEENIKQSIKLTVHWFLSHTGNMLTLLISRDIRTQWSGSRAGPSLYGALSKIWFGVPHLWWYYRLLVIHTSTVVTLYILLAVITNTLAELDLSIQCCSWIFHPHPLCRCVLTLHQCQPCVFLLFYAFRS